MGKISMAILAGFAAVSFGGTALAQDMTTLATKTRMAPWAAPNEEAGLRLNPSADDTSRYATLAGKPRQAATFSTASEDAGLNPGFPSGGQTTQMGDIPEAGSGFSVGGFGRAGATPGPAGTPPEPRSVDQAATVTLGFETASADDRSLGMTPNTVRLGR
jgi:hypothetical protein